MKTIRKAHDFECADRNGNVVRVRATVRVLPGDHYPEGVGDKEYGEVDQVQATPHHAVLVAFSDGSSAWFLGPCVEVQQ